MMVAYVVAAVLAGAFIRGYTGFGASMVWVVSLSLVFPPAFIVPIVLMLEAIASLPLLAGTVSSVHWRSMTWLLGASVVTMPAGVALLATVPERPMRIVVAVVVLLGTLALASGVRMDREPGPGTGVLAGAISGVANGSTGMGGPPAVLLYFSGGTDPFVGRATLIMYFLCLDLLALAMATVGGLFDADSLRTGLWLIPLVVAGVYAGSRLFSRTRAEHFRPVVLGVLAVLCVAVLVRAAMA